MEAAVRSVRRTSSQSAGVDLEERPDERPAGVVDERIQRPNRSITRCDQVLRLGAVTKVGGKALRFAKAPELGERPLGAVGRRC